MQRYGLRTEEPNRHQIMPRPSKKIALSSADASSFDGVSVLLVEDTWLVAVAMKAVLEHAGLNVIGPAASVRDAETLLVEQTPHVAIVDINLQDVMAFGLIDQLYATQIPVVVVSGYETLPEIDGKVAAILTKPVRTSVLLDALHQILGRPLEA